MVLFHKLPPTLMSFGDISDYVLRKIMKNPCTVCFFVTDYYLPDSVKSLEGKSRSEIGLLRMKASRRDQQRPKQFRNFWRLSQNKTDLVRFLIQDWSTNAKHCDVLDGKELYVTLEDEAHRISSNRGQLSKTYVEALSSQQEEADTKMFLAAQLAYDLGFAKVNIITIDTDVAILAIYYQSILNGTIFLEYGTSTKVQIYDMSRHSIDESLVRALLGIHALSGCDSTSCFDGKGKVL